jgi:AraC-like DNA-binding protein
MYHAKEPYGEVIVDEVLNILRHYKLIYPEDVALLMDVKVRDLRSAWFMLTGTRLIDVITEWRLMQAQDAIRKKMDSYLPDKLGKPAIRKILSEVATRCGWRTERVMSNVFERYCGCTVIEWVDKTF